MTKRRSEEEIGVRQLALNSSGVSSQMNFSCETRGFCPSIAFVWFLESLPPGTVDFLPVACYS